MSEKLSSSSILPFTFCRNAFCKRFPKDYRKSIFSPLSISQIPKKLLKMIFFSWFHSCNSRLKKLHQFRFSLPRHCHILLQLQFTNTAMNGREMKKIFSVCYSSYQLHSIRFWVPFFVPSSIHNVKSLKNPLNYYFRKFEFYNGWMMTPCVAIDNCDIFSRHPYLHVQVANNYIHILTMKLSSFYVVVCSTSGKALLDFNLPL